MTVGIYVSTRVIAPSPIVSNVGVLCKIFKLAKSCQKWSTMVFRHCILFCNNTKIMFI